MRQREEREFLNPVTIFNRVQGLSSQPSAPYNYMNIYDRLTSKKYKDRLFLSREGEGGKKEYMVLQDLPCQKCRKQDGNMIICSNEKCSAGWHRECLPGKHRLEADPPPEDDWFCPGCKKGHQGGGNGPKEAPKVRGA